MAKTIDFNAIIRRSRELALIGVVHAFFGTIDAVRYLSEARLRLQTLRKR